MPRKTWCFQTFGEATPEVLLVLRTGFFENVPNFFSSKHEYNFGLALLDDTRNPLSKYQHLKSSLNPPKKKNGLAVHDQIFPNNVALGPVKNIPSTAPRGFFPTALFQGHRMMMPLAMLPGARASHVLVRLPVAGWKAKNWTLENLTAYNLPTTNSLHLKNS